METMRLSSSIFSSLKQSSLPSFTFQSSFSPNLLTNSKNFISRKTVSPGNMISNGGHRNLSIISASKSDDPPQASSFLADESFFRNVLASMETVYTNRNPTAKAILELVRSADVDQICYDHLAYRTFGVNGHGIDSIAKIFLDFGYTQREELRFPAKKLKALWFAPPTMPPVIGGSGVHGPLPRVFISQLLVDEMSIQAQEIIRKYTELSGSGYKHAALASALGSLTWGKPSHSEFQQLAK